jgi:demethylmenaquinone methyltransferase / 2-methoxy-6-polyprenyl-1,4-benzoquinol methylase
MKDTHAVRTKQQVMERLFGSIAERYDRFNACVSLTLDHGWRDRVIREALHAVPHDACVLDVCTGTGDLALGLDARLNGAHRVVGLDLSDPMLRLADQKAVQQQAQVSWMRGDAHQLPFQSDVFDAVTIGFSTRNVPDLREACREMCRVLDSGGRLVILEAGKPQGWLMRVLYYTYLTVVMPVVGVLVCGRLWPFRYLRRSIIHFLQPPAFQALLQEVGFASVQHYPLHHGLADLFIATKGIA